MAQKESLAMLELVVYQLPGSKSPGPCTSGNYLFRSPCCPIAQEFDIPAQGAPNRGISTPEPKGCSIKLSSMRHAHPTNLRLVCSLGCPSASVVPFPTVTGRRKNQALSKQRLGFSAGYLYCGSSSDKLICGMFRVTSIASSLLHMQPWRFFM